MKTPTKPAPPEENPLEVTCCGLCTENFLRGNMYETRLRKPSLMHVYVCDGCREAIANATPCIGL